MLFVGCKECGNDAMKWSLKQCIINLMQWNEVLKLDIILLPIISITSQSSNKQKKKKKKHSMHRQSMKSHVCNSDAMKWSQYLRHNITSNCIHYISKFKPKKKKDRACTVSPISKIKPSYDIKKAICSNFTSTISTKFTKKKKLCAQNNYTPPI